ncbi:MAG: hypothetical protein CBB62_10310 [Micavibrio sp. TMED2]|nr:hypothetical protein [Alphaproteobacteria bacterium]MAS47747.1 hypothetical protein [Alphaproteobacteria bacterium]MAX96911.1 hypothetical protein [Alphaproteobacteria bacterium]OUT40177.1 MAG: hypothetical protein CBB62_10310 [Micavibrio sp. TMED2]HAG46678.1 hypothetical protein [Gammaproteobacteria bacterium]|tara:strand:- start:13236 stop:13391 length:156 start_codon:yes stop_codon:yes gene_type:complete
MTKWKRQIDALNQYGCDQIHGDHGSTGAIRDRRGLNDFLDALEEGATLIVL